MPGGGCLRTVTGGGLAGTCVGSCADAAIPAANRKGKSLMTVLLYKTRLQLA
jgi:hypothetical protein